MAYFILTQKPSFCTNFHSSGLMIPPAVIKTQRVQKPFLLFLFYHLIMEKHVSLKQLLALLLIVFTNTYYNPVNLKMITHKVKLIEIKS